MIAAPTPIPATSVDLATPSAPWPTRRSAVSAQLLTQFGLDHGLSLERCLAGTGLNVALLADPGAEIEATQELTLLSNLARAFAHRPGLGLKAGLRYPLNTYGIWGFALLSSPTFRSAASLGMRYLDLTYAFHRARLEEIGDEAHLILDDSALPDDLKRFVLERDSAGVLGIQRALINLKLPLRYAGFRGPEPTDLSLYIEELGIRPQFGQADNRLVFDRHLLDLPLPGANAQVVAQCERACQAMLARRQVRAGLAAQIRDRLLSRPGRLPDMEQVARELHISSRTLRRRLELQGIRFRDLLDEVRQALAEELLATGGLRLEEIAERLGYGELSNFMHAFKRWKGITPGQFRRER